MKEGHRRVREDVAVEKEVAVAGFEEGRGPQAKGCRQPLQSVRGKGTDSPLEPTEGS